MTIDQRGTAVLDPIECENLLAEAASSGVGRIAVDDDPSPHVIPVNFTIGYADRGAPRRWMDRLSS